MEKGCEVHRHLMRDGKCTCEEIRQEKLKKEIDAIKEKFWSDWQGTPEVEKLSWIQNNLPYLIKDMITMEDGRHILQCMDSMIASLCGKHPGGDFVEAVLNNDLILALDQADDLNQIVLRTYELFLYNKVPHPLRRK